jgi:molybdate transport system substrate-binding protein
MMTKLLRSLFLGVLTMMLLIGCAQLAPPRPQTMQPASTPTAALTIAAATSLQKVLQEITPLYSQSNVNQKINYNFAASGILQQQIEQGAPTDVFISAADRQMQALEAKGLLAPGTQKDLLTNQLVLIVPKQSTTTLTSFQQLIQPDVIRIAVGEPRSVPVGQYAREVLENLGILAQVQSKLVFGNNVKSVLTAVETGDADAGIVYLTDAKSSDKVTVVAVAEDKLHSPIRYAIAILKSSHIPDAAQQYVEFLQSATAKRIFERYGFGIVQPKT